MTVAPNDTPIHEGPMATTSGWPMLGGGIAAVILGASLAGAFSVAAVSVVAGILIAAGVVTLTGLTAVFPRQPRVITIFGRYLGTVHTTGLRWVYPLTRRRVVSIRVRNLETALLKVNDADGNPIEVAAVVVWQITDTAMAVYGVENFEKFMAIQTEAAVRHVTGGYPYDVPQDGRPSLRQNAAEITSQLSDEITTRVVAAGIQVVESRISRLSYAPEIAQAMLRRQQADAVVAARQRIVEGAVSMVRLALDDLAQQDVVELDEERKAAMVSNLLVVLCSDHATQPVVNTGTLYQ